MIITIDGPAGSGKSSAAKGLAQRLGFEVLDTGAMYRAVALVVTRSGIQAGDSAALEKLLRESRIKMPVGRVLVNGEDVTALIRTQAVSETASRLAAIPLVRRQLADQQRAIGKGRNMVSEGRDQGTAVFPDAACKFYLTAEPAERARRRWQELRARGEAVALEAVRADQEVRDRRDASRDADPMTPAPGAIVLDTTHLTLEQVLDRLEQEVRRCWPA